MDDEIRSTLRDILRYLHLDTSKAEDATLQMYLEWLVVKAKESQ